MDELIRGLSLLGPKLEQMSVQIDILAAQVAEQKSALSEKADSEAVLTLRQELCSLTEAVSLKNRQQEEEGEHFHAQLSEQVRGIIETLRKRTESEAPRWQKLEDSVRKAVEDMAQKASMDALIDLQHQVSSATSTLESKVGDDAFASLTKDVQALRNESAKKAPSEELQRVLDELKELQTAKADAALVDKLLSKDRTLTTALSEKAEFTELEQLKIQLHALNGSIAQRSESSSQDLEQINAKLEALSNSVKGLPAASEVKEAVNRIKEHSGILDKKADAEKFDVLVQHFEMLSDIVAPKLRRGPAARPTSARGCRRSPLNQTA
eukprot:TRINITY_DN31418_c0_g1_i1.p1 TRINITY_DN31418_c0_g1~~TRINITY_DN31418_c0_g1_i1.p1  ORF type:complete len:343 (+),score=84.54 TRINITY_DN31418_c0_g1_i1:60-1031(+)